MAEIETMGDAKDLVTCPMCFNVFDSPRSLPCCHCFCLNCIRGHCKDKTSGAKSSCPLCKQKFEVPTDGVEDLPHNEHLQKLIDFGPCRLYSGEKASVDGDELKALSRRLHGVHCNKHDDKMTTSHCLDCRENVCASCSQTDHKKHQLKSIESFAAELKTHIQADITEVCCRKTDIGDELERVKTEREKFIEDLGRQATAVKQKGEEMKCVIDRKVEELLEELEKIKTDSLNLAQSAETLLQQAADTVHSYCEYSQEIQIKGKPHDVVRYASAIHAQATSMLENPIRYADYSGPCVMFIATPDVEQISTQQLLGCISTPLSSSGSMTFF